MGHALTDVHEVERAHHRLICIALTIGTVELPLIQMIRSVAGWAGTRRRLVHPSHGTTAAPARNRYAFAIDFIDARTGSWIEGLAGG